MSELHIYDAANAGVALGHYSGHSAVARQLAQIGARFEHWQTPQDISAGDSPDRIIAAYQPDIDRLMASEGYQAVDVISLAADHPGKVALRQKFLSEHTHAEDEVRFFVAGRGLFSLHVADRVYEVLCGKGDLIGVPANTRHWFDMGPEPEFVAIRLFNNPQGWIAQFTGDPIAERFNRLS
jgi:1,2-dihydroxy-3-keto-5-methylthiopentene dioxygenase